MIYSIFPKHTATIYERYPKMNTSKDEILELNKTVSSSLVVGTFNTKILLDFGASPTTITGSVASTVTASYFLNLYAANVNTPDNSFYYDIGAVDTAWGPGLGRSTHTPKTNIGVSWDHPSSSNSEWAYNDKAGFDNSFNNVLIYNPDLANEDLKANISPFVNSLPNSAIFGKGILISRTAANEADGNKYGFVNFYSAETSTVYKPRLEIHYADDTFVTGSLTALDLTAEHYVYQVTNPGIYKINSTPKFRFTGRAKYPTATYTASTAALVEYLPTSSYYSLVDVRTGETVVPFDTTYTKISCDATGNFANLKLSGLYPDRPYQFHIRIDHNGTSGYHILDDMFRVYE
jgi:hypothetical protein